ncbi:MAG: ATP-dependent DNA helicase [Alphaproteobacteria bacterium]|jgi:ATP-dependent DNA helicase DinG|nr:ATP-dependent DNA helicase [Alphaproteobacteria bacterium]
MPTDFDHPPTTAATPAIPALQADALVVGPTGAIFLSPDGEIDELPRPQAARRAQTSPPLLCHGPAVAAQLGTGRFQALDLLELFAFVRPADFCLPTPRGLAAALMLPPPRDADSAAAVLPLAAQALLEELAAAGDHRFAPQIAQMMAASGWIWGPWVLGALRTPPKSGALPPKIWESLPEWREEAPPPPPGDDPVAPDQALKRLARLLGSGAESRPQQQEFAAASTTAFAPRAEAGEPNVVLAEAGTGVGKTLAYIAPASVWAERNQGPVWVSTYTRNLQRQVDQELDKLFPDPAEKRRKSVVRKGRENYLCLLNLAESTNRAQLGGGVALGLMMRWVLATRDGDTGGDFPAWLPSLVGYEPTLGLTDRRGECIYSACDHYQRCFIERTQRRARTAQLVIANHALVMANAVRASSAVDRPTRIVFDEGHHLFDAADSAFSSHLSGVETAELRRWIRGAEGGRNRRARGLEKRISDLAADGSPAADALHLAVRAAGRLPSQGWMTRVRSLTGSNGSAEAFLAGVHHQVQSRQNGYPGAYSLEAATTNPDSNLVEAAAELRTTLIALAKPLEALNQALAARLDDDTAQLETSTRQRIEAACRGLEWRRDMVKAWASMLTDLESGAPDGFVDWFSIERSGGNDVDVGMHRHWIDPTQPFAGAVLKQAHGVLITSASLRDSQLPDGSGTADDQGASESEPTEELSWLAAEVRTGAHHLALPARRVGLESPFDYGAQTQIYIVRDVRRDDPAQVAAAYRDLFLAAGGGGLGLFTAIQRLRGVHEHIAAKMADAGISLLAQHVDAMDTGTLVDIFRAEPDSCLLGTDAVRDGVDVPGRSLRLIIFDRVPWPRPDILHRARKAAFGGAAYDDRIARLRLKQAFGRLVRQGTDRGVFVMLDSRTPTRLTTAFPKGVEIQRTGIKDAIAGVAAFLGKSQD